ncbi:hypothetical protein KFK14_22430 [Sphingobium phenoxybenzoativorans]|uniref:Uncharacterized protein n=1 Tax=Sphingobium phenoxybenzoativorans TaxID=1592790 RepID=A0A975K6F5_9SPHN|nr:hypothetical protein [Sphingobium phenoxybenzoativorans]QUT05671.1 hypothetical protein KFK14_22430 [Sphingobium phenoxybenzoativorans]
MSVLTRRLDPLAIAAELDQNGFACIENAIDPKWIEEAQSYVNGLVSEKGRRYFALTWPSRNKGTPPHTLGADPDIQALMGELARIGCPSAATDEEIYTVLRVVAGASGEGKSLIYHYDKYVITALVPVFIPPGPKRKSGELLIFPNKRRYRAFAWLNILEKAIVQSGWYRRRVTDKLPADDSELDIKILKPGNLYFFWGYRTYHTNFPVSEDVVRATMLLHHGDPHPSSLLLKAWKAHQIKKESRILESVDA